LEVSNPIDVPVHSDHYSCSLHTIDPIVLHNSPLPSYQSASKSVQLAVEEGDLLGKLVTEFHLVQHSQSFHLLTGVLRSMIASRVNKVKAIAGLDSQDGRKENQDKRFRLTPM